MPSYIVTDQKPVRIVGSAKGMGGLNVIVYRRSPVRGASLRVQPDTTEVEHRSFSP